MNTKATPRLSPHEETNGLMHNPSGGVHVSNKRATSAMQVVHQSRNRSPFRLSNGAARRGETLTDTKVHRVEGARLDVLALHDIWLANRCDVTEWL